MNLLQQLEAEQMAAVRTKKLPEFRPGDTLKVNVKVVDVTYDEKAKQNKTAFSRTARFPSSSRATPSA